MSSQSLDALTELPLTITPHLGEVGSILPCCKWGRHLRLSEHRFSLARAWHFELFTAQVGQNSSALPLGRSDPYLVAEGSSLQGPASARPSTLSPPQAWLSGHTSVNQRAGAHEIMTEGAPVPLSSEVIAMAGIVLDADQVSECGCQIVAGMAGKSLQLRKEFAR